MGVADRVLKVLLLALGAAAILIGSSIYCLGAQVTAAATERLTDLLLGRSFDGGEVFTSTADSELRFYAPLWIAYGAALVWTSGDLVERRGWVLPLAGLFLAGGLGRVLSWLAGGPPRQPFIILMGVELTLPIMIAALAYQSGRKPRP